MTEKIKQTLIRSGIITGIIILIFSILYGVSFVSLSFTEKEFVLLAEKVCRTSPYVDSSKLIIKGLSRNLKRSYASMMILSAQYNGKDAFLFFLPITGKYGIYSAVFLYLPSHECVFCGLGVAMLEHPPHYYGITSTSIRLYTKKIQTIMEKEELLHEK